VRWGCSTTAARCGSSGASQRTYTFASVEVCALQVFAVTKGPIKRTSTADFNHLQYSIVQSVCMGGKAKLQCVYKLIA